MRMIKRLWKIITSFFQRLFHKETKNTIKKKNVHIKKKQKVVVPLSKLPECFYIDDGSKEEIINSLKMIYERLNSNDDQTTLLEKMEFKSFHDNLINDNINKNYNYLIINDLIKNVDDNKVSYYLESQLNNLCDNMLSIKNLNNVETEKVIKFSELFKEIIKDSDDYIIKKTKEEYDKVNYITISNIILDEVCNDIKKIDNDINKHKHNKYYYEKKIRKIKRRILELEKIKEKDLVWNEILILRNDIYTKSKDKYDLLYNDEVYINLIKQCDLILDKVNKKVIDINDNKKIIEKKDYKKQKKDDILSLKIYKRYQDLAIARRKILLNEQKFIYPNNKEELVKFLDDLYCDFLKRDTLSGFNYQRNLIKCKAVILDNNLTKIICSFTGDGYLPLEHINTKMDYILQDTFNKKQYLELILHEKDNYSSKNSIKVDEKINKLLNKENITLDTVNNKVYTKKKIIKRKVKT